MKTISKELQKAFNQDEANIVPVIYITVKYVNDNGGLVEHILKEK